jgi:tRNA pseudouridine55 synthase
MTTPPFEKIGHLLINKPTGISSYDCIRHIKKILNQKAKIGHAGTLDVFASGLLIIGIGRQATKHLQEISDADKQYTATGKLGYITDTLDHTGRIIKECPWPQVTKEQLEATLANFAQRYEQMPPAYSALKYEGKPLYELARTEAKTSQELAAIVQNKKRIATIKHYTLDRFEPPLFTITITVPKGTYIRALINDVAQACGSCATTQELRRTKIGNFSLEQAVNLEALATAEDVEHHLLQC